MARRVIIQKLARRSAMIDFKRILFPVDFSDKSRAAASSVKAMASRFGAKIVVLHVVDLPPALFGSPEAAGWSALINSEELRKSARVALDRFIEQEFPGVEVTAKLAEGDAANEIVDFAGSDRGTLIMMPTPPRRSTAASPSRFTHHPSVSR